MYNQKQVHAIAHELRDRLMKTQVKDYEIVITLLTMEKAGKITTEDVSTVLLYVYFGNKDGALRALEKSKPFVSDTFIDAVIAGVSDKNREEKS